jgi:hypothetical protein
MWLLHFIPDSFLHLVVMAVLFSGIGLYVAGLVMNFWLATLPYREPVRIISTILIIAGVYFYGSYDTEMTWRNKIAQTEVKIAKAEEESQKENVQIVTKVLTRKQIVQQKGDTIIQYVDREVAKYDSKCEIPVEFVKAHNDAAAQPDFRKPPEKK